MDVVRILNLTEDEIKLLISAGTLLGSIRDAKDTYDKLGIDVSELLEALKTTLNEIKS